MARTDDKQPDKAPYQTTLVVPSAIDGREVARLKTGADGRFRLLLPPGEYRVKASSESERAVPRAEEQQVKVLRWRLAHVTIRFYGGLR